MKIWNSIFNRYQEVIKSEEFYINADGEKLIRIETKGKTGKSLYKRRYYIRQNGQEDTVMGMDGATGHGWGGRIVGYMTEKEIQETTLKIK